MVPSSEPENNILPQLMSGGVVDWCSSGVQSRLAIDEEGETPNWARLEVRGEPMAPELESHS